MTLIFVHIAMHSVFLSVYLYTEFYDQTFIMPNIPYTFGGNTKYLTHWNLVFQIFYFGLSITIHLVMSCNKRSQFGRRLCRFRDWFLAAIAFPFASIVVFIFWTLCVIDRELISNIPPRLQELIPVWLNQVIHTYVLLFLLVDMYLIKHMYPSFKSGFLGTLVVGLAYLAWVLYLGFVLDVWVYGIMKALSGAQFGLFFFVIAIFFLIFYIIGEKINNKIWSSTKYIKTATRVKKVN